MAQGKVVAFLRSLPGQTFYWLPGQMMANSKMYRPEEPLHKKFEFFFRRKAIWEMAALSATICGIEFCYAAETAFVSPLLRLLGTPTYFTSMVWGCSPILGVFVTPIFGSLSDACNSRFGRRRPFIVALSLIVLLGLTFIGSAVSVAQKTEAEIMADYNAKNVTLKSTKPRSPLRHHPAGKVLPDVFYDNGPSHDQYRKKKRELLRHRTTTASSAEMFFPALIETTTRRIRRTSTTTTTTEMPPPAHRVLNGSRSLPRNVEEEEEEEFGSTTTPINHYSSTKASKKMTSTFSKEMTAEEEEEEEEAKMATTTSTTTPSTTTLNSIQNLEAVISGQIVLTTTETPPTAAAVHHLPIGMAILGVILMDFGCDASQSPCRTYLLDVCLPEDHRLGLRTFTVSAGIGGTIGYLMGGLGMGQSGDDEAAVFFQHLKVVYTVIGILFVIFVCSTIFVFKEPTLEEWRDLQAIANENEEATRKAAERIKQDTGRIPSFRKLNRQMSRKLQTGLAVKAQPKQLERLPLMATKSCSDAMQQFQIQRDAADIDREESEASFQYGSNTGRPSTSQDVLRTKSVDKNELDRLNAPKVEASEPKEPTFLTYIRSISHMPRSVGLVCLTNYFSWMSLVCYSLYFTDFCGQIVFDGEATAPYGTPDRITYEDGVRFGACGMSLYSLTCCIYSLFAERIYKRLGLKYTYLLGPSMYSFGLVLLIIVRTKWAAIFLSLTAGLMYSTLFTMPYILIGKYHAHQVFEKVINDDQEQGNNNNNGLDQQPQQQQPPKPGEVRGLGTDIALVSSMVFLAQFSVSLLAGPLAHAMDTPIVILAMGALAAATTALMSLKLYYPTKS